MTTQTLSVLAELDCESMYFQIDPIHRIDHTYTLVGWRNQGQFRRFSTGDFIRIISVVKFKIIIFETYTYAYDTCIDIYAQNGIRKSSNIWINSDFTAYAHFLAKRYRSNYLYLACANYLYLVVCCYKLLLIISLSILFCINTLNNNKKKLREHLPNSETRRNLHKYATEGTRMCSRRRIILRSAKLGRAYEIWYPFNGSVRFYFFHRSSFINFLSSFPPSLPPLFYT